MEASSTLTPNSDFLDVEELTAYKYFNGFNLFLFSREVKGGTSFLLFRDRKSNTFIHVSGAVASYDPNLVFCVIREYLTLTHGLLSTQNFKYFLAQDAHAFGTDDEIVFEKDIREPFRPHKHFTPAVLDICKLLCECSHVFQDHSSIATYFLEVPLLNLNILKEIALKKDIDIDLKYYTLEDIVGKRDQDIAGATRICFENPKLLAYAHRFIEKAEPIEYKEHYAIVSTGHLSPFSAIHYSAHKKHGENWKFYKAFEGELPTEEELKRMTGILLPGSPYHAYDDIPWFKGFFEWIRKVFREYKHINILGICFGAQVVAQALGGRVDKMEQGFFRGQDVLYVNPSFYELEYVKGLDSSRVLAILQAHGDHIVELPQEAVLQASSATADVEIYTIGDHFLSFQGHPEYSKVWNASTFFRQNNNQVEDYDKALEEYIKEKFPVQIPREDWLRVCYQFLKRKRKNE